MVGSTQAGGGRTFRMLVTVGSALRMSLGLGWMLAFSADFRCGACSLSAILGTHKKRGAEQEEGASLPFSPHRLRAALGGVRLCPELAGTESKASAPSRPGCRAASPSCTPQGGW